MKIIHDSTSCLLHLLLLAELFVHSSSRPANSSPICGLFQSMIHQVERLISLSKKLHDLTDDELLHFAGVENRLDSLPHMQHDASYFSSLKVNKSLSQLYEYTQSFRLHVDWLKENITSSSQSAEGASTHLLQLSRLINTALHQIGEEVPQSPSASFPVISADFDVLQFSVEISERLQVFCDWSKRVLWQLRKQSGCPKH